MDTSAPAGVAGSTSSSVALIDPSTPQQPPTTGPTGAELVAAAAVAKLEPALAAQPAGTPPSSSPPPGAPPAIAEPDLPALEPVRLPRKGAGARLKQKLLGATARENWIEVLDPNTNEIEECLLLSPTVTQADRIVSRAMTMPDIKASDFEDAKDNLKLKDVSIDQAELKVQALIACLRDPETRQPLLDQTHRLSLLEGPLTYLFSALADEAREMLNPSIAKAKKNSKRTRAA